MGRVITGVDVVDADQTDLDIRGAAAGFLIGGGVFGGAAGALLVGAAAGRQAERHDQRQQQCKELLHSTFLLKIKLGGSLQGTKRGVSPLYCHHTGSNGKIQPDFYFF